MRRKKNYNEGSFFLDIDSRFWPLLSDFSYNIVWGTHRDVFPRNILMEHCL